MTCNSINLTCNWIISFLRNVHLFNHSFLKLILDVQIRKLLLRFWMLPLKYFLLCTKYVENVMGNMKTHSRASGLILLMNLFYHWDHIRIWICHTNAHIELQINLRMSNICYVFKLSHYVNHFSYHCAEKIWYEMIWDKNAIQGY